MIIYLKNSIILELKSKGNLEIREFDPEEDKDLVNSNTVGIYKLKATIVEIAHDKDSLHLVSHINGKNTNQFNIIKYIIYEIFIYIYI